MHVHPARFPKRYRMVPCGPEERAQYNKECGALLERARQIDQAQRDLAEQTAGVRHDLAAWRVVMWPKVEPKDIVYGYRRTRVNGPPPIPPIAPNAYQAHGKDVRYAALAVLAEHGRAMKLVEIHRALHLGGYAIVSKHPVKRLADALGYETRAGRAFRIDRGVYKLGILSPGDRRRVEKMAAA